MGGERLHDGEVVVGESLARRLLAASHPAWADLPLRRLASSGTDHVVYRLGDELVVRFPRIAWAEQQVARESTWLPVIGPRLADVVAVAAPVAVGEPGAGYPFRWLVSRWVPGVDLLAAAGAGGVDEVAIASDLAGVVRALWSLDVPEPAPLPGKRGRSPADRDGEVRQSLAALAGEIDVDSAAAIWADALAAEPWPRTPVWLHGDLLPGNVVVRDGRVVGVIDWSSVGVGDPACDAMVAFGFGATARAAFRSELGPSLDDDGWARARGWVIEQTAAFIPYYERTLPTAVAAARRRLHAVLAD